MGVDGHARHQFEGTIAGAMMGKSPLRPLVARGPKGGDSSEIRDWLRFVDAFRTMCFAPSRELGALFEKILLFNGGRSSGQRETVVRSRR